MTSFIQGLIDKLTPLSSTAQGLVVLVEHIAAEVSSSDDPVKKAAEIAKDIADYAEQVDAALHANAPAA